MDLWHTTSSERKRINAGAMKQEEMEYLFLENVNTKRPSRSCLFKTFIFIMKYVDSRKIFSL